MPSDLPKEYMELYLSESKDLLEKFLAALEELKTNPGAKEPLKTAARSMHTLASNSAVMGFEDVSKFTRELEYKLDDLYARDKPPKKELLDLFLVCHKVIETYLKSLDEDGGEKTDRFPELLEDINKPENE